MARPCLPAACLAAFLLAACAAPQDPAPITSDSGALDDYIRGLAAIPVDDAKVVEGERSPPERDGDYSCSSQNLQETRQYDRVVALSAGSESLWPGAIVAGDSVESGLFTQLVFDRSPLAVSVSLENLAGGKSVVMEHPSLSSFRDAIGTILETEVTGATPANLYSEIENVYSEKQLSLALGASVGYAGAKVAASFNWDQHNVMSRYVVKYTQAYYTVDVDQPSAPSALFAPGVTVDDLRQKMGPGDPPVYVSSVTYGRMVIFTFESSYSSEELGAALDFAYKGGVDVAGNTSVTYRDIISSSHVTAFILGGSGGEAAQSIDSYDALIDFIKKGGNYSKDSPGAPIAYKLAYLKDNAPARLSFTTDYTVKECARVSQKVKVTLENIKVDSAGGDYGNNLELYGAITVASAPPDGDPGTPAELFSRDAAHAVVINEGETWPQSGSLSETIVDVVPQPGGVISLRANLFDSDGPVNPDDSIGDETVAAPFDSGWRKDVTIYLTGSGARVIVTLHLEPV